MLYTATKPLPPLNSPPKKLHFFHITPYKCPVNVKFSDAGCKEIRQKRVDVVDDYLCVTLRPLR